MNSILIFIQSFNLEVDFLNKPVVAWRFGDSHLQFEAWQKSLNLCKFILTIVRQNPSLWNEIRIFNDVSSERIVFPLEVWSSLIVDEMQFFAKKRILYSELLHIKKSLHNSVISMSSHNVQIYGCPQKELTNGRVQYILFLW